MTATQSNKPNGVDERAARFVSELAQLDRGDLAGLRRSLGGDERGAYWLEGLYVRSGYGEAKAHEKEALGLVAGLYALKPPSRDDKEEGQEAEQEQAEAKAAAPAPSIGVLMGRLYTAQGARPSTEKRFLALLDADRDGLPHHLRQAVTLLATENLTPDWTQLVGDLLYWGDRVRRRWARDFYGEIYREARKTPAGADSDTPHLNTPSEGDTP